MWRHIHAHILNIYLLHATIYGLFQLWSLCWSLRFARDFKVRHEWVPTDGKEERLEYAGERDYKIQLICFFLRSKLVKEIRHTRNPSSHKTHPWSNFKCFILNSGAGGKAINDMKVKTPGSGVHTMWPSDLQFPTSGSVTIYINMHNRSGEWQFKYMTQRGKGKDYSIAEMQWLQG